MAAPMQPIEAGGCAPPIIASPVVIDHASGEQRRMDRAYTEAGMMSLREYVEKWGDAL